MNSFLEHHKDSIRFHYRCFDRILLNGLIQPFQRPERVVGFFDTYRKLYPVCRDTLRGIADRFQFWLHPWAAKRNIPILDAPKGRRDEFVEPYFKGAKPDEVVVVLKAREPARIMIAIGDKAINRWHRNSPSVGSFSTTSTSTISDGAACSCAWAPTCHSPRGSASTSIIGWPLRCARKASTSANARMPSCACAKPERLQELADQLMPRDLVTCGQKWLARFTPFFSAAEREQAGCQHRLFFAQTEFCDNLVFHRRAALDRLGERLIDANRSIGQPNKITTIFGRKVSKLYRGKLQTEIENMDLPNPVIRSHYRNGFIKQYVRDHLILRTEAATNNVTDYGVRKGVDNLSVLRGTLSAINDNYLNVQQDIVETFIDRGQLRRLAQPTITPTGKRIPGLKLDNSRQLALMHALVRFSHIAAANSFTTAELHPRVLDALGRSTHRYTLASLRYDLSKLRAKGLVEKLPRSRRYRLLPKGYSICLVFLKLFERVYAPLTAGLLSPLAGDAKLNCQRRSQLDRLYQRVVDDLNKLIAAVGLKAA